MCVPVPDPTICSPGANNTELVMRDKRCSVVQPCTNKQDLIPLVNSSTILSREGAPSAWAGRGRGWAGQAGEVRLGINVACARGYAYLCAHLKECATTFRHTHARTHKLGHHPTVRLIQSKTD